MWVRPPSAGPVERQTMSNGENGNKLRAAKTKAEIVRTIVAVCNLLVAVTTLIVVLTR